MPDQTLFREPVSVIRRFAHELSIVSQEAIARSSLREGAAFLEGTSFAGADLSVLDLSSYSTTGTFKDWVACVTVAYCLDHGIREFVTQTSGNTGNALATYASQHGIRSIVLYPSESRQKIHPEVGSLPSALFIEIAKSEPTLKIWTRQLANDLHLPWLPSWELQIEANKLRAWFLRDAIIAGFPQIDWHVQALSSGYGVFGFYEGLAELGKRTSERLRAPKLLGVQQEAIAPFFEDLSGICRSQVAVLEPALFRSELTEDLRRRMRDIRDRTGGSVIIVSNSVYHKYEAKAIKTLEGLGIRLGRMRVSGETKIIEKSGLLALIGALNAAEQGLIEPGQHALVCITGGAVDDRSTTYVPSFQVSADGEYSELISLVRSARS